MESDSLLLNDAAFESSVYKGEGHVTGFMVSGVSLRVGVELSVSTLAGGHGSDSGLCLSIHTERSWSIGSRMACLGTQKILGVTQC